MYNSDIEDLQTVSYKDYKYMIRGVFHDLYQICKAKTLGKDAWLATIMTELAKVLAAAIHHMWWTLEEPRTSQSPPQYLRRWTNEVWIHHNGEDVRLSPVTIADKDVPRY